MKFIHEIDKLPTGKLVDRGYWEIVDSPPYEKGYRIKVENSCGGYHYRTIKELDEIVDSDWETVERNYFLNKSDSNYGWIDKEGNFFGCDYFEHDACARACFGMNELIAELKGYIKIYQEDGKPTYYHDGFLTDAQRQMLINRGIELFSLDKE